MILIYSHTTSQRLQYTCNFIFKELLCTAFSITIDSEEFKNYNGSCINYSEKKIKEEEFRIESTGLIFENAVTGQNTECFTVNSNKAFFKTDNADYPFDILSAIFYLLSRYEEYLPHTKDAYGRYAHENALAFKEGFLNLPLINIWVKDFAFAIQKKLSAFNFQLSTFNFLPTYDIDIAYSYKHKGFIRNLGGFIKSPSLERIKVLVDLQKDPFDSYDWLDMVHKENNLQPVYFFLVPEKNGVYDKNILPHKNAMWQLVKQHAKKHAVGIHPSWQSGDKPGLLKKEKEYLEAMAESSVTKSRQHYIRFSLPESYQQLTATGITDDYTMGYGSINGFRASVASSFYWYDLQKEEQTGLRIHPFCFMDANAYYEQKQTPAQTAEELQHYLTVCKESNATLVTIWHNNFLGTAKEFTGWREMYEAFIKLAAAK